MKLRELAHKYMDNLLEAGEFDTSDVMCMFCPLMKECAHSNANTCKEVFKKFIEDYPEDEE